MSNFREFWKKTMHKEGAVERIKSIDTRLLGILGEMQKKVDPTRWNELLAEQEDLEKEREELVVMTGPFKDENY